MNAEGIRQILRFVPKALLAQFAPGIVEGALSEMLKNVTVKEASKWVTDDVAWWDKMKPEHHLMFETYVPHLGDCSWFTCDYVIHAVTKTNPGLASLFLGWDDGYTWLEKQIEIIRSKVSEAVERVGT